MGAPGRGSCQNSHFNPPIFPSARPALIFSHCSISSFWCKAAHSTTSPSRRGGSFPAITPKSEMRMLASHSALIAWKFGGLCSPRVLIKWRSNPTQKFSAYHYLKHRIIRKSNTILHSFLSFHPSALDGVEAVLFACGGIFREGTRANLADCLGGLSQTHASGRWLGSLPQGSPKGDMSGSEGGNAPRHGGVFRKRRRRSGALHENDEVLGALDDSDFC